MIVSHSEQNWIGIYDKQVLSPVIPGGNFMARIQFWNQTVYTMWLCMSIRITLLSDRWMVVFKGPKRLTHMRTCCSRVKVHTNWPMKGIIYCKKSVQSYWESESSYWGVTGSMINGTKEKLWHQDQEGWLNSWESIQPLQSICWFSYFCPVDCRFIKRGSGLLQRALECICIQCTDCTSENLFKAHICSWMETLTSVFLETSASL